MSRSNASWWPVVALAALVFLVWVRIQHEAPPPPLAHHLRPLTAPPSPVLQRELDPGSRFQRTVAGMSAYAAGDYERAAADLGAGRTTAAGEPLRLLYLGSALALAGNYVEGERILSGLPDSTVPPEQQATVRWTRCIALLATGRLATGDSLLAAMVAAGEVEPAEAAALRVEAGELDAPGRSGVLR